MIRRIINAIATLLVLSIPETALANQRVSGIPLGISIPDAFRSVPVDQERQPEGTHRVAVYRDFSTGSSIGITVRNVPQYLTVEELINFLQLDSGQKYSKKRVVNSCARKIGFLQGSGIVGKRHTKFMEAFYVIHDSSQDVVYTLAYTYPRDPPNREAIAAITCG